MKTPTRKSLKTPIISGADPTCLAGLASRVCNIQNVRLARLAELADRLSELELERVDGMAEAEAQRQARQIKLALDYASGKPVAEIANDNGCALSYPGYCARRWGVSLRRAGAAWGRAAE